MLFKPNRRFNFKKSIPALLFVLGIGFSIPAFSTHNRAGEIIYQKLPGTSHKYRFTIITYTEINNGNADRPELAISFGDGGTDSIKRTSKSTYPGRANIQRNEYETEHTYSGPGKYKIWVEDPNRNGGVINIPNSINTIFYIESELSITPGNDNNSPTLQFPPIDFACVNSPFYHNPGASDIDGDSLVYSLEKCKADSGKEIPGYSFPSATNTFAIDPKTGTLTWDVPDVSGEYNIAIRIREFRRITTPNGKKAVVEVGSILRDMQITVEPGCSNRPPEFENLRDYCVVVGDTLNFTVIGTDENDNSDRPGTLVTMEVEGAPFEIPKEATYNIYWNGPPGDPVYIDIQWVPGCNHVRKRTYDLFYKIEDNGYKPLANFGNSSILVIAPPVPNFQAEPQASSINLTWDSPRCLKAQGYKIYRKEGSSGFEPDSCETGVPDYLGYDLIAEIEEMDQLTYLDDNGGEGLIPGEMYCYLIITYYQDGAESIASEEVCAKLKKDVPILTNVSIRQTAGTNGSAFVAWSKANEFDAMLYPGPYRYRIYRTEKRRYQDFQLIDSLEGINDTLYIDSNLNTTSTEYAYKIEMMDLSESQPRSMGFSVVGTSIFLSSEPTDNRLKLFWNESVPWRNEQYVVIRLYRNAVDGSECIINSNMLLKGKVDSSSNLYILELDTVVGKVLDTTSRQFYTDSGLTNNKIYRYLVYSIGEYSLPSITKPLYNISQLHCESPIDNILPCSPGLELTTESCENVQAQLEEDPSRCSRDRASTIHSIDRVSLNWENGSTDNSTDCDIDDIIEYHLFYSSTRNGTFIELDDGITPDTKSYDHMLNNTRAGCYYITAVDSVGNLSEVEDTLCVDNCLLYRLPNVFTPNGDNHNDYFEPFPFCFIESIDLKVFNRWGTIVFKTKDPFIKWDGHNQNNDRPVSDGVYFYTCIVNQITVDGIRPVELKGNVHVLGSGNNSTE